MYICIYNVRIYNNIPRETRPLTTRRTLLQIIYRTYEESIRYDHSMYNTLFQYSASHGFIATLVSRNDIPPCVPFCTRARLFLLSPAKSNVKSFRRERIGEVRCSFCEERRIVSDANVRKHSALTIERFRGRGKSRTSHSEYMFRILPILLISAGESDRLYCT